MNIYLKSQEEETGCVEGTWPSLFLNIESQDTHANGLVSGEGSWKSSGCNNTPFQAGLCVSRFPKLHWVSSDPLSWSKYAEYALKAWIMINAQVIAWLLFLCPQLQLVLLHIMSVNVSFNLQLKTAASTSSSASAALLKLIWPKVPLTSCCKQAF